MKALTLTQPWATLVALDRKGPETRGFRPESVLEQRIAVHAAKSFPDRARALCFTEPFASALAAVRTDLGGGRIIYTLPVGEVVATAVVSAYHRTEDVGVFGRHYHHDKLLRVTEEQYTFGDYSPGRFAWVLEDIVHLTDPIPARGAQSFWEWNP